MADLTPPGPENSNFTFIMIDAYSLRSQADQVAEIKWQIYPLLENSNFRFILIDAYSEISGTPGGRDQVADLTCPPINSNF